MNPETFDAIIAGISEGKAVRNLCPEHGVSSRTFYEHMRADPEREKRYARAKDITADIYAEEMVAIADDSSKDWAERQREDGSTYTELDHEHVNRARLRIDTRKWAASKLAPKRYGDRVTHVGDETAPLVVDDHGAEKRAKAILALIAAGSKV